MKTKLHKALLGFDGKSTDFLSDKAARFCDDPDYLDALVLLFDCRERNVSDGATWLFKQALENGAEIFVQTQAAFAQMAPKTDSWAAQLHVCQIIGRVAFSPRQAQQLAQWLHPLLSHNRPFLRAWSLDALVSLGMRHEGLIDEARTALQQASEDVAASVRARTRQLAKLVPKRDV